MTLSPPVNRLHTAVALWITTGANDLQVARWAGHRRVAFGKDRYGHLYENHAEPVVARLDALTAEASTGHPPSSWDWVRGIVCPIRVRLRTRVHLRGAAPPPNCMFVVGDTGFEPVTSAV